VVIACLSPVHTATLSPLSLFIRSIAQHFCFFALLQQRRRHNDIMFVGFAHASRHGGGGAKDRRSIITLGVFAAPQTKTRKEKKSSSTENLTQNTKIRKNTF
jgi:hypothetical protein